MAPVTMTMMASYPFNMAAGVCGMGSYYLLRSSKAPMAAGGSAAFALLYLLAG